MEEERCRYLKIFQFGVGGTGSYLCAPLIKYLNSLVNMISVEYILIDDDIVEEKNVYRQNFRFEDIGNKKNKVYKDYGRNYNKVKINDIDIRFDESYYDMLCARIFSNNDDLILIVGCVDNIDSRLHIAAMLDYYHKTYKKDINQTIYYIDSGNFINSGQIFVFNYNKNTSTEIKDRMIKEFNTPDIRKLDEKPGCSDNGDQSIMANLQAASILYNIITEIISLNGNTTIEKITFMRYHRDIICNCEEQFVNGMY